ncbi:MAG: redoxin family protein [Mycobacteriales bacterium]
MSPRRAAFAAAVVAVLAAVAVVVALSTDRSSVVPVARASLLPAATAPQSPELAGITHFDNTAPLTLRSLRGRVVLVDFWTYTCINCRRTFPFLRALSKHYEQTGLTVLGVHSPEFAFERNHDNVARAIRELGVTWPVAEDPQMATWQAFSNEYWPADYLVDRTGRVRFFHAGEGGDTEVEDAVRALLAEGGTVPADRLGDVRTTERPGSGLTPETYFGAERGASYLTAVVPPGRTVVRHDGGQPRDRLSLDGTVTGGLEYLELGAEASVTQRFRARDIYATSSPGAGPVVLDVTLDGAPVPAARRGSSLTLSGGRTVVVLRSQDLLHLVTGTSVQDGTLRVTARTAGARFFTFTYGG